MNNVCEVRKLFDCRHCLMTLNCILHVYEQVNEIKYIFMFLKLTLLIIIYVAFIDYIIHFMLLFYLFKLYLRLHVVLVVSRDHKTNEVKIINIITVMGINIIFYLKHLISVL